MACWSVDSFGNDDARPRASRAAPRWRTRRSCNGCKRSGPLPAASSARARAAVDRIRDDDSELHELWQDTDDYDAWLANENDLAGRLGA